VLKNRELTTLDQNGLIERIETIVTAMKAER